MTKIKNINVIAKSLFCMVFIFSWTCLFSSSQLVLASSNSTTFLVDENYDRYGRESIEALLNNTSEEAYFYVDQNYYDDLSSSEKTEFNDEIIAIADNFDEVIYPEIRRVFGEEWNPGIDSNDRITILFSKLDYNVGGYFNPNDEYSKEVVIDGNSNEREMIYINPDFIGDPRLEGFIAHELQHMITWNQKTKQDGLVDDVWSNESRSEFASALIEDVLDINFLESNLYNRKKIFLLNYSDSLTDWENKNYDYSSASIFAQYLKDQFGVGIFKRITSNSKSGLESIDLVLKDRYQSNFKEVFTNWTIANYINNIDVDPAYGYKNENLQGKIVKQTIIKLSEDENKISMETDLENWSSKYYEVNLEEKEQSSFYIDINFDGDNTGDFQVPYVVNYKNGDIETSFMKLDSEREDLVRLESIKGNIESVIIIPSSQNTNEDAEKSYSFKIDVDTIEYASQPISNLLENGSLIRLTGDEKIYVIEDGIKRWIANPQTFIVKGYNWEDVITVSSKEIGQYPEGEVLDVAKQNYQNGTIIKGTGPEVYLVYNNQIRWIRDESVFNFYAFNWSDIITVGEQELNSYPQGEDLITCQFENNSLIKGDGPEVYLVENGRISWISSPEVFNNRHYEWSSIIKTTDEIISHLIKGQEIR